MLPVGTLTTSFCFIQGVGPVTERRLWQEGFLTWDYFLANHRQAPIGTSAQAAIRETLLRTSEAFAQGKYHYLRDGFDHADLWRTFPTFREHCAYLDIETTGLHPPMDVVTLIGLYDGNNLRIFERGKDLDAFPSEIGKYPLVVSFNGRNFDVPFLERSFPRLKIDSIHWDLRWAFYRVGIRGTLKEIEDKLGLGRPNALAGLGGFDAVALWGAHERGDPDALSILKAYLAEDVMGLASLAERAYNLNLETFPLDCDPMPLSSRPVNPIRYSHKAIKRIFPWRSDLARTAKLPLLSEEDFGSPSSEIATYWIYAASLRPAHPVGSSGCGGKWLIFKPTSEIDEAWALVARHLERGALGKFSHLAKVSTRRTNANALDPTKHVICVYTPDYRDEKQVMIVRDILRTIGFKEKLFYKTDEATVTGKYAVRGDRNVTLYQM